jgi:hypothetical protein
MPIRMQGVKDFSSRLPTSPSLCSFEMTYLLKLLLIYLPKIVSVILYKIGYLNPYACYFTILNREGKYRLAG